MRRLLLGAIDRFDGSQYSDIRYEVRQIAEVSIGEEGTSYRARRRAGGFCRAMYPAYAMHVVFTDPHRLPTSVPYHRSTWALSAFPASSLIEGPVAQTASVGRAGAPLLESNQRILERYAALLKRFHGVSTVRLYAREERCRKYFANSCGSWIEQEQQWEFCLICVLVNQRQSVVEVFSAPDGTVFAQRERVEDLGRFAESVSLGTAVPTGCHTVVLDPQLSGAVMHETVGHACEADNSCRSRSIRTDFAVGCRVAPELLSVVDDATLSGSPGSYGFDDEGVAATRTPLIAHGVVVGKLHSLATAATFGVPPTGNGRAADFHVEPVVRCSNTVVTAGSETAEELVSDVNDGVFLRGVGGGHTRGDEFTYRACGGWRIRNGKLAEPVGNVVMRGRVLDFLANIDGVGDAVSQRSSPFCVKRAQPWMPVWSGSPALRIRHVRLEV